MELIAVTDHNSVRTSRRPVHPFGLSRPGLLVLSGVELDCTHKGRNFHLLGYGFDHTRKEFAQIEQEILDQEKMAAREKSLIPERNRHTGRRGEVLAASSRRRRSRRIDRGYSPLKKKLDNMNCSAPICPAEQKSDMPNVRFYWDFFSEGKPAYVCLSAIYPWLMRYR